MPPGTGELYAINVDPDVWGAGAGPALMDHVQRGLAGMGYVRAVLWVLPGNLRARRFYEKHGWQAEGVERTVDVLGVTVPEMRYRCVLGPAARPSEG
jgi:ribosomal protein S18 acetylase RimI-like enzyme